MRFPFTFMGVGSLVMAAWILVYGLLLGRLPADPLSRTLTLAGAGLFGLLGLYLVGRRVIRGPES